MSKIHNLLVCECVDCINYWVDLTNNMIYTKELVPPRGETYKMKFAEYNKEHNK